MGWLVQIRPPRPAAPPLFVAPQPERSLRGVRSVKQKAVGGAAGGVRLAAGNKRAIEHPHASGGVRGRFEAMFVGAGVIYYPNAGVWHGNG